MKTPKARKKKAKSLGVERAAQMLKIAACIIREHCPEATYGYDGVRCDGICIADDCEASAETLTELSITEILGTGEVA
jgi:hypothetical protein